MQSRFRLQVGTQQVELRVGELEVGRAEECGLMLADERCSRRHGKYIVSEAEVRVTDLGSRNGTYVNGERLTAELSLRDGDEVRMGKTTMRFSVFRPRPKATVNAAPMSSATLIDLPSGEVDESDVLNRVLKLGRLEEAEKLLRSRVSSLVRTDPPLPPSHALSVSVINAMVELAEKSLDAAWIHRLFRLHLTCKWYMPQDVQQRVERLIRAIGRTGGDGVESYVAQWLTQDKTLTDQRREALMRLRDLSARTSKPSI